MNSIPSSVHLCLTRFQRHNFELGSTWSLIFRIVECRKYIPSKQSYLAWYPALGTGLGMKDPGPAPGPVISIS